MVGTSWARYHEIPRGIGPGRGGGKFCHTSPKPYTLKADKDTKGAPVSEIVST